MTQLDRTEFGSPISVPKPRRVQVSPSKTAMAISQLAAVGGKYSQVLADEEEVNLKRQAENDLINGTINPDKLHHKSAYAYTVGQGQALESYGNLKSEIEADTYSDLEPEEFQKMLRDKHNEYYKGVEDSDTAAFQKNAYDSFTLKNEGTLKAAQAGKWRVRLGENQGAALYTAVSLMAKEPDKYTAEHILDEIYNDKYSLLDDMHRKQAAFGGASEISRITGNTDILKALNDELGFVVDPSFRTVYNSAIRTADQKKEGLDADKVYNLITQMEDLKNEGILTDASWGYVSTVTDASGSPIWTPKQFKSMVRESRIIKAKLDTQDRYESDFKNSGDSMSGAKQSTFNEIANRVFQKEVQLTEGDTVGAHRSMGTYLVTKSKDWDELKDRCKQFGTIKMMYNDKPNPDAKLRFRELEALEEGMNAHAKGSKIFASYMGDSLGDYFDIKTALDAAGTNVDTAWASIAESLEQQKEHKKKVTVRNDLSEAGKQVGIDVKAEIDDNYDNPFIPNFLEDMLDARKPGDSVAVAAAVAYDKEIAKGKEPATARYVARSRAMANTTEFGNELYDVSEKNLKVAMGVSDLPGAWKSLLDDPIIDGHVTELFGVTIGEIYFGMDEEPVKPDEIRKYKKERAGKSQYVGKPNIRKIIDMEKGTLEFKSERMGGASYKIPLRLVGEIHQAKLQKLDELDLLDRYYSPEHLDTDKGVTWANKQNDLNDEFITNTLSTPSLTEGYTTVSQNEYIDMTDKEKTRVRKQFYKDKYSGFKGTMRQIKDFFRLRRMTDDNTAVVDIETLEDEGTIEPITTITEVFNNTGTTPDVLQSMSKFITKGESFGGDYDTYRSGRKGYSGKTSKLDKPLTEYTVADIMTLQAAGKLDAVGAYQITPDKMRELREKAGLKKTDKFTKVNQDKMFKALLKNRTELWKWATGTKDANFDLAARDLAREWASIPLLKDTVVDGVTIKAGSSRYPKNNTVGHTVEETKAFLESIKGKFNKG